MPFNHSKACRRKGCEEEETNPTEGQSFSFPTLLSWLSGRTKIIKADLALLLRGNAWMLVKADLALLLRGNTWMLLPHNPTEGR